jgi:hypothetical protein
MDGKKFSSAQSNCGSHPGGVVAINLNQDAENQF